MYSKVAKIAPHPDMPPCPPPRCCSFRERQRTVSTSAQSAPPCKWPVAGQNRQPEGSASPGSTDLPAPVRDLTRTSTSHSNVLWQTAAWPCLTSPHTLPVPGRPQSGAALGRNKGTRRSPWTNTQRTLLRPPGPSPPSPLGATKAVGPLSPGAPRMRRPALPMCPSWALPPRTDHQASAAPGPGPERACDVTAQSP